MVENAVNEFDASAVAQMVTDFWKLIQSANQIAPQLPDSLQRRFGGQVQFSERQLMALTKQLNLKIVTFEGEDFHLGLAATADNIDDYGDDIELEIEKMLEPAIMRDMGVVRRGRVLVKPKE